MKLIKINLNQTVSKAQLEQMKEERNRWILFGFIASLFLGSITWFYMVNDNLNYVIKERKDTILEITNKTKELTGSGKINLSKIDIKNLDKLENKRIYWSDIFLELSKMTPEDMSITKFIIKGKNFKLHGIVDLSEGEPPYETAKKFKDKIDANEKFNENFKDLKVWKSKTHEKKRNDNEENKTILEYIIEGKLK